MINETLLNITSAPVNVTSWNATSGLQEKIFEVPGVTLQFPLLIETTMLYLIFFFIVFAVFAEWHNDWRSVFWSGMAGIWSLTLVFKFALDDHIIGTYRLYAIVVFVLIFMYYFFNAVITAIDIKAMREEKRSE